MDVRYCVGHGRPGNSVLVGQKHNAVSLSMSFRGPPPPAWSSLLAGMVGKQYLYSPAGGSVLVVGTRDVPDVAIRALVASRESTAKQRAWCSCISTYSPLRHRKHDPPVDLISL